MKTSEVNFREVYHKICFIEAGKSYASTKSMPNYEEGNGTLVYGYIDCEAGLTYEVLACAVRDERGNITPFEGNDTISLKFRAGSVSEDEIFILEDDPQLAERFRDKIDMVNEGYCADADIDATRNIKEIDESRDHDCPDDILVILLHGENNPEGCWVRCKKIENGMLVGTLLNEPDADFTVHRGDLIPFGIIKQGEKFLCIAPL